MAQITDQQVLDDIATALHLAGGAAALQPFWTSVAARVNSRSYNDIVGMLISRKYTIDQINNWDELEAYSRDLALFFAFTSPQGQGTFDKEAINSWDIRPQLKTLTLVIGGQFIAPTTASGGETSVGEIGIGGIDTTALAFTPAGPDPGRFEPYRSNNDLGPSSPVRRDW